LTQEALELVVRDTAICSHAEFILEVSLDTEHLIFTEIFVELKENIP
jgi:hypothetical protein